MNSYKLSLATMTLTITKAFEEAVATGKGVEYNIYQQFMTDFPGLKVVRKTHKSPSTYTTKSGETFKCNQFKNLTYERMEKFITALPNAEELMVPYLFLKESGSSPQTSAYPIVRRWFVAQFPEFRTNPLFYLYNNVEVLSAASFVQKEEEQNKLKAAS